ncbi:MAG: hypothetical protein ACFCVB_05725 [Nodosilinea sp.]
MQTWPLQARLHSVSPRTLHAVLVGAKRAPLIHSIWENWCIVVDETMA